MQSMISHPVLADERARYYFLMSTLAMDSPNA